MSITSEDLQKFYQENNIDDQSFNSYQQFLEKKTKEGEAIKQAFQQYHNITDDFVSFLTITGFTKQHCGNLDFYQQMKFYEDLAHSPIKVIFACFQNYTLEEVMNDPLLMPALSKICQQLDKHQDNSAFMELVAEVPFFNSIINSEIVFENLEQNEILLSNIDIEMQLKEDKNEKDEKEKIKEKDRLELEEKQFISQEVERIDWDHTYQKIKEEWKNKNNNTNEKEVDYGYLFEDSSEENDHQVNKIGEIHQIHENFDN